jgi:hypothetical protein
MSADHQDFLSRWSRLKRQASVTPESGEEGKVCVAPPELPAIESLKFESDFGAFMQAKVDQGIRRAALKKLFSDPRFNIMDGLDVYIDDYSKEDPIPPGMLAQLEHARTTLFGPQTENKHGDESKPPENNQIREGAPPSPAASNLPPETITAQILLPNQDTSGSRKP